MKIVDSAIRFPVTTAVGVILVVMFGLISFYRIPIQLTPTVDEPEIMVRTIWPGASPEEVEREIVEEQEEQLKGLEGLRELESQSQDSRGTVQLTFQTGTDMDTALLKASNFLQQVPRYPDDADKPLIRSGNPFSDFIAWFILVPRPDGTFQGEISELYNFVDDFVKARMERVPGVSLVTIYGGRESEMQVIVDPASLAARQLTLNEVAASLERENRNYSGGDFDEGKRRYVVRTVGEYQSPKEIENVIITRRNGVPIYLRDVARARLGYKKPQSRGWNRSFDSMALPVTKVPGSNVLEVMEGLKEAVAELNEGLLAERGLVLVRAYDSTDYIYRSIGLVRQSLLIGGALAIGILLLFLRSGTSTLIVAFAIPISVVGTFLMMNWFGRTLNVISLAGMAFAVGMVVDNSIVVLENIYRHRQMGKPRFQAAYEGAREVWGAVLASTLTTIAVFVPVVFVQEEAGQLFRDIAIAISCAVGLSLIVSMTVIPSLSAKILHVSQQKAAANSSMSLLGLASLARWVSRWVPEAVYWICGRVRRRLLAIAILTATPIGLSFFLMPKTEYLPTGNENLIIGIMLPPPGYNLQEVNQIRQLVEPELKPLWESEPGSEEALRQPGGGIEQYFFVSFGIQIFMGAMARDPDRVRELIPVLQKAVNKIPGTIGVVSQTSLFQSELTGGRNIRVDLTGPSLEKLIQIGGAVFQKVLEKIPEAQARPIPSLDLGNPEVRVIPHRRRAADLGISNRDLAFAVNALVDGVKVSDYKYAGREIDLTLRGEGQYAERTHEIENIPIATPNGKLVPLSSVAEVKMTSGPIQINHIERERAISIAVTPPDTMALEEAMGIIREEILQPLQQQGLLAGPYSADMRGTADKLTQTREALQWNLLLALAITYLLMAALFQSFLHPFVIMLSVPLAAMGGFLGLRAVNLFLSYQALDVLTMLGFVILIGIVVNNAILIVHQALNNMRQAEPMAAREAIRESVQTRIRPIFMSVSTSVLGMMPLVLFPGAGSELYRGLGGVVVGGLILSTVFTLFLVPAMFSLSMDLKHALTSRIRSLALPAEQPAE